MRTIVDLPENHVKTLDILGKKHDVSRAELVRRAVEKYIESETKKSADAVDKYFGIFKDDPTVWGGMDGMAWQRKMRAEWDDRDAAIDARLKSQQSLHDHPQEDYKSK